MKQNLEGNVEGMQIIILSFGYRNGIPQDADVVIDVRFLPNPYDELEMRRMNGLDQAVKNYVLYTPITRTFQSKFMDLLRFLLLQYAASGKSTLTIAFGCTEGQHRSVVIAEYINEVLKRYGYPSTIQHRDLQLHDDQMEKNRKDSGKNL